MIPGDRVTGAPSRGGEPLRGVVFAVGQNLRVRWDGGAGTTTLPHPRVRVDAEVTRRAREEEAREAEQRAAAALLPEHSPDDDGDEAAVTPRSATDPTEELFLDDSDDFNLEDDVDSRP